MSKALCEEHGIIGCLPGKDKTAENVDRTGVTGTRTQTFDSRPWHHWYSKQRWLTLRSRQLWDEPLCEMCRDAGRIEAATVVDHKQPHKGDSALFWNRQNLQSLCKAHHDVSKQRDEVRGFIAGSDATGHPIDPGHHWNAA